MIFSRRFRLAAGVDLGDCVPPDNLGVADGAFSAVVEVGVAAVDRDDGAVGNSVVVLVAVLVVVDLGVAAVVDFGVAVSVGVVE